MKRKNNAFSILFLFLLFQLILIFIASFVTAQEMGGQEDRKIFRPILDLFTFDSEEAFDINIAKYLFFVLVGIMIWSVFDTINIFPNRLAKFLMTVIITFLSVAYLTPREIWLSLVSYGALGMTLLLIFPLLVLSYFTVEVAKNITPNKYLFQHGMWIVYTLFLVYRFIEGLISGNLSWGYGLDVMGFIIVLGVCMVMVFFNSGVIGWLRKEFGEGREAAVEQTLRGAAETAKALDKTGRSLAGERPPDWGR